MSAINNTHVYQVSVPMNSSSYPGSNSADTLGIGFGDVLSQIWSLVTIWRLLVLLLLVGNLKNIPFIWHLRIINAFRFCCRTQRPKVQLTSAHIFQPLITTTHAPILEIDFNLHKSNSTYFSDVDVARTHLVCTLFSHGIEYHRGGTAAINPGKRPLFGLALGAVSCSFRRELKPYETYDMWSRVLTWDEKWIYIVTHFVRKGAVLPKKYSLYPQQNTTSDADNKRRDSTSSTDSMECNENVVATALSKCVFKAGRRTVSPALMLKLSGLLPTKSLDDTLAHETPMEVVPSCSSSDSGIDVADSKEESELERIEKERQRGMRVAMGLAAKAQNDLELEFSAEDEALGRHSDGTGITGVVSCLAQLAHLKKNQIL